MDCQLTRSGLADLSPGYYRSPGVHASTLLSSLALRFGHYERDKQGRPISDLNRELGNTLEHSIAQRAEQKHPGAYLHNPEILCDGVYITPDLVTLQEVGGERYSWSIKLTRMSPSRLPDTDVKMWRYREQLKAELYALRKVRTGDALIRPPVIGQPRYPDLPECLGWQQLLPTRPVEDDYLIGYLTVLFINDYRPHEEQCPTWRFRFYPEELAMTWAMLMQEKERQEQEGSK